MHRPPASFSLLCFHLALHVTNYALRNRLIVKVIKIYRPKVPDKPRLGIVQIFFS